MHQDEEVGERVYGNEERAEDSIRFGPDGDLERAIGLMSYMHGGW